MNSKLMNEIANMPLPNDEKQRGTLPSSKTKVKKQEGKPASSKPFRLQNRWIMLTYKEHIEKEELHDWISDKIGFKPDFIRSGHETAHEDTPYEHTHCVIDFGKAFQTRNCRFFDIEGETIIHPHIQTYKKYNDFENAKRYIAKEDPENADLLEKPCIIEGILNCTTTIDALKNYCHKTSDATAIIQIHNLRSGDYRTDKPDWSNFIPRPWQMFVLNKILTKPDGRTIDWFYCKPGNSGKSTLGDYCEDHPDYANKIYFTDDMGNSRDCATIMEGVLAGGWTGNTIVVDLTRCTEHHDRMYDYLEKLANGRITSQKYRGKRLKFNKCHIMVTANYLPHFYNMSADRWKIREIMEDYTLRDVSLTECSEALQQNSIHKDSPYRLENWPTSKKLNFIIDE